MADFVAWQVVSGRVADAGSAWWRAVNGLMMLDVDDARRRRGPWCAYARRPNQRGFWAAHRASLDAAVAAAASLLSVEPATERAFIRLALGIVAEAADANPSSDTADFERAIARFYPRAYPISSRELDALGSAPHG